MATRPPTRHPDHPASLGRVERRSRTPPAPGPVATTTVNPNGGARLPSSSTQIQGDIRRRHPHATPGLTSSRAPDALSARRQNRPTPPRDPPRLHAFRSHDLRAALTGREHAARPSRLSGWCIRPARSHGGVIFIDLRDHYGNQPSAAGDPDSPVFAGRFDRFGAVEFCIRIDGTVKARDPDLVNPQIPRPLGRDRSLHPRHGNPRRRLGRPAAFQVFGDQDYPEETPPEEYRYLDLRPRGDAG